MGLNFFGKLAASMPLAAVDELSDDAANPGPAKSILDSVRKKPASPKGKAKAKAKPKSKGGAKKRPAAALTNPDGPGDGDGDVDPPPDSESKAALKSYKCLYRRDLTWGIKLGMRQLFIVSGLLSS